MVTFALLVFSGSSRFCAFDRLGLLRRLGLGRLRLRRLSFDCLCLCWLSLRLSLSLMHRLRLSIFYLFAIFFSVLRSSAHFAFFVF